MVVDRPGPAHVLPLIGVRAVAHELPLRCGSRQAAGAEAGDGRCASAHPCENANRASNATTISPASNAAQTREKSRLEVMCAYAPIASACWAAAVSCADR